MTAFLLDSNYNFLKKGIIVLTTEWEKKSKSLKISITWLYLKYKWKKTLQNISYDSSLKMHIFIQKCTFQKKSLIMTFMLKLLYHIAKWLSMHFSYLETFFYNWYNKQL